MTAKRNTEIESSDRQALWKAFLKKMEVQGAPRNLSEVARSIEHFLLEPVKAIHSGDPLTVQWRAPGPWH